MSIEEEVPFEIIDYPDWTVTASITVKAVEVIIPIAVYSSQIMVPMDLQGSTIMMPVDIQGQMVTLDINIVGQEVLLNINIASITSGVVFNVAQSGAWTVNAAQTGTWTINVGAPLDASGNLKTSIQSSVTLNVYVTGSATLNVNISSVSAGVTFNVNITGSVTLNVNIQNVASGVTFNVYITGGTSLNVNIVSSVGLTVTISGTANVNIANAVANISALRLMDTGTIVRAYTYAINGSATLYTVPAGKKAYIYSAFLNVEHWAAGTHVGYLYVYDGTNTYVMMFLSGPDSADQMNEALGFTVMSIPAGWSIRVYAGSYSWAHAACVVVETSA